MAGILAFWLRGQDSNLRPLGYEPNELPLLHPAPIYPAKFSVSAVSPTPMPET